MGINNKHDNTRTQFIYKAGLLSNYVAYRIDNNQNIKRFLTYYTINPLGEKGLTKDNKVIDQPNVEKSLIDSQIYDGMFNEYMEELHQAQIYIYTSNGRVDNDWGYVYLSVSILVPMTFERLANFGEKRSFAIGNEIEGMFQDICIAKDNAEDFMINKLGNLKFQVVQFTNTRLSKTNNIVVNTIVLKVGISARRLET